MAKNNKVFPDECTCCGANDWIRSPKGRNCRPCASRRSSNWAAANSDQKHDAHLKRTFGIDLVEYNRLLEAQQGVCAVCRQPETSKVSKRLCVHHDHATGKVIALLCRRCNIAMGQLNDDPVLLRRAAELQERGYYEPELS